MVRLDQGGPEEYDCDDAGDKIDKEDRREWDRGGAIGNSGSCDILGGGRVVGGGDADRRGDGDDAWDIQGDGDSRGCSDRNGGGDEESSGDEERGNESRYRRACRWHDFGGRTWDGKR